MSAPATPEHLFQTAFRALLPDLRPEGPIESMFAEKISRHTVLSDLASAQIVNLDPSDDHYFKKFRQLSQLVANYDRVIKFAYTELRRLQTERAVSVPNASIYGMPRLARTAILTTSDRVHKSIQANEQSLISIDTARTDAEFELFSQELKVQAEKAMAKAA